MYLFEFTQDGPNLSKIVALSNQLEEEIKNGKIDPDNYTVDDLLGYFQLYDVILDANDLYNMIKEPPLDSIIQNIQGDKVVFKGHEGVETHAKPSPDNDKKVVSQMAKKANRI